MPLSDTKINPWFISQGIKNISDFIPEQKE
jgi:hypothetical protein